MRTVADYFSSDINQALYHYTGVGSLVGMSKSKSLWASNIYYLNDSKEITHACDVLSGVLEIRLAFFKDTNSPLEFEFLNQINAWINSFRTNRYNIFIFSLSEVPSLLSQWRSYTPHGKGVSIGFSPDMLKALAESSKLRIAQCLYNEKEQEELLRSLLEKLLITFRQESPHIDITQAPARQGYYPLLEKFRGEILQVLSIIKHKAFQEELEWRLISPYFPSYISPMIKFREGASMLVPYIELPLGMPSPHFSSVILGPSLHPNLSMSALSMFLSNQGLCNNTINCDIPYREW